MASKQLLGKLQFTCHKNAVMISDADTNFPSWDPVTGLGTPNYPKMKDLWLSLP